LLHAAGRNSALSPRHYNLGEEKIAVVGSAMVQIGCLAAQWERRGEIQPDPYFEPLIDKELLYAGRVGDNLHISYREYFIDINAQKNRWGSYGPTTLLPAGLLRPKDIGHGGVSGLGSSGDRCQQRADTV
jgi:hypothetical protein